VRRQRAAREARRVRACATRERTAARLLCSQELGKEEKEEGCALVRRQRD